jgi:hypothetical protein
MNKEFIPYEQALELKELGFDKECLAFYHQDERLEVDSLGIKRNHHRAKIGVLAPTFSQAFRWFREKYGLDYEITYAGKKGEYHAFSVEYIYGNNGSSPSIFSYEEAELACLKKLIIIVERKPEAYN